jgi:hypothetical protein
MGKALGSIPRTEGWEREERRQLGQGEKDRGRKRERREKGGREGGKERREGGRERERERERERAEEQENNFLKTSYDFFPPIKSQSFSLNGK